MTKTEKVTKKSEQLCVHCGCCHCLSSCSCRPKMKNRNKKYIASVPILWTKTIEFTIIAEDEGMAAQLAQEKAEKYAEKHVGKFEDCYIGSDFILEEEKKCH